MSLTRAAGKETPKKKKKKTLFFLSRSLLLSHIGIDLIAIFECTPTLETSRRSPALRSIRLAPRTIRTHPPVAAKGTHILNTVLSPRRPHRYHHHSYPSRYTPPIALPPLCSLRSPAASSTLRTRPTTRTELSDYLYNPKQRPHLSTIPSHSVHLRVLR